MKRFAFLDRTRPGNVQVNAEDMAFVPEQKRADIVERTPQANWALLLMLAVVVTTLTWASLAQVDEITKAEGRVVADGKEQVVANLEGGLLSELLVKEGQVVVEGQALAQIDRTRFESQQNEGDAKLFAMRASIARLEAEAAGRAIGFGPLLKPAPAAILAAERESFAARRRLLDDALAGTRRSLDLLRTELAMSERLSAQGLMSEVEVMRLKRQASDLDQQMTERVNRFRQEASAELAKARGELAQLEQQMVARKDVLQRTTLRAPVRGLIKSIKVGTVGGVIQPGAPVLEILPLGPRVLIEARIKASQIGFVRVGQSALVKLATYDYNSYGGMAGTITYLSPDAGPEEGKPQDVDSYSYRITVSTEGSSLMAGGKSLPVLPGMTATVEIQTGKRAVIDYLLRPVLKSRDAFRER